MTIAYFSSLEQADVIEAAFVKPGGDEEVFRLLVDSGFTGQSCFVLPENAVDLAHAFAPASQAAGALLGTQKRVVVNFRIDALSFHTAGMAILADTSNLSLPVGVRGIAGLRLLRLFRRWGAERTEQGSWQFLLES